MKAKSLIVILPALLLFICVITFSQEYPSELLLFSEDELEMVSTKTPMKVEHSPALVTVFTSEQMKNMGIITIADLLQLIPGIYISGGERHLKRISVRGITSSYNDKVLLMIDGSPLREIFYQHAFIGEFIPVENIERIEVIRGPGSALYGTNAFAGIINIITKSVKADSSETNLNAGFGTSDTQKFDFIYHDEYDEHKFSFFARYFNTKGDGTTYGRKGNLKILQEDPVKTSSYWFKYDYLKLHINAKYLEYHHTFTVNCDIPTWVWHNNWFDYNDYFFDVQYDVIETQNITSFVKIDYQHYDNPSFYQWVSKVECVDTYGNTCVDYVVSYDVFPYKETQWANLMFQVNCDFIPKNKLILGGEYNYEEIIDVRDLYINRLTGADTAPNAIEGNQYDYWCDPMTKYNMAFYLEDIISPVDNLDVTLGVRYDNHDVFGNFLSPRVGIVLNPFEKLYLKLLYGEAFRAPSYRELFLNDTSGIWIGGNKELEPETIRTYEFGIDYLIIKNLKLSTNVYQSYFEGLIERGEITYINSEEDIISKGVELQLKYSIKRMYSILNFSYNKTYNKETDELLPNLPLRMANIILNYNPLDMLNLNLSFAWVGDRIRYADDMNWYDFHYPIGEKRPDVDDYILTNFRMLYSHIKYEFSLTIQNLFNVKGYDPYYKDPGRLDIEIPGRTFLFQLQYRFL